MSLDDKSADPIARQVLADGFFAEIYNALTGGAFLTGLSRELGAGPMGLALVAALPFLAQVGQCAAPQLLQRVGSYRRVVLLASFVGRMLWLVPALLPWLAMSHDITWPTALTAIFVLAAVNMVGQHSWTAWMAEIVPPTRRTQVFGLRVAAVTCGTLLANLLGALLLDHTQHTAWAGGSYLFLGGIAVLAGWSSVGALRKLPDAKPPSSPGCSSLMQFLRTSTPAYGSMLGLFMGWGVAIGVPAPFWSLCMLEHLHMSFLLIGLHDALVLTVRLACNKQWTKVLQRVGNRRVLMGCAFFISMNPLIWLFITPTHLWPIWVEAVWTGFMWTGFNQAAFLRPLEVLQPHERSYGLAVFSIATGAAQFGASLLGGAIMHAFNGDGARGFAVLFITSSVLRFATTFAALRRGDVATLVTPVLRGLTRALHAGVGRSLARVK